MQTLRDDTFQAITSLMHQQVGLHFTDSKKPLVSSRLAPRMQHLGVSSFEDYVNMITEPVEGGDGDNGSELQVAIDLLTTNETYFFREPAHYELIEAELKRDKPKKLSVWSAAASYGDEAYSLAMLLADLQQQGRIGDNWSLVGTDISDRVLRSAVEAVYPLDRLRAVTPERLRRYCWHGEGGSDGLVQIAPKLRERVRFGRLNLCHPIEDLGPFDIVLLRNVLIYFDAATKREVVDRVLTQLKPGGLFFIGTAEGRVACNTSLQSLAPGAFRKLAA
ncbi:MAG: SAM-dependent methyltransferase [Betaproteobacteria bacterium]|nr:SAM-dependent methyltransferase [Betaproteobacteria bacterium]